MKRPTKRKRRQTCEEYLSDRMASAAAVARDEKLKMSRDRKVEELFSDLERQVLIDRLSTDAAQRERA